MRKKILVFIFIFTANLILPFFNAPAQAAGATLFLSPASGTYTVGRSFTVKIMVNSGGGVGINAAEGAIKYDPSVVSVASLSDANSIFKLWTTNPTYSNTSGTISFGGGSPGGYTGEAGNIFAITFTAKKAGEAAVNFTNGIVLAADGKGTNVFSGFGQARYTIKTAEEPAEEPAGPATPTGPAEPQAKGILPPMPEVNSISHPKEDQWYSDNEPEFIWKLLSDLTGVSYLIDKNPESDPGSQSDGIVESKRFDAVEDGEWYFHIKYQNKFGWGQPAHLKFMADVTPPEDFNISVDSGGDPTDPSPKLVFRTSDEASGIDYYDIRLGMETKKVGLKEVENGYYQLPPMAPGEYDFVIAAFDKAGNGASSTAKVSIEPLRSPIITDIPKLITNKDELIIRGTSFYPRVTVKIFISRSEKETQEVAVKTDDQGNWSYFHRGKIDKGSYEIWAKIIDDRGAQSLDSTKYLLTVESAGIVEVYGWLIILILLLIIMLMSIYIWYIKRQYALERERIKSETAEMKSKLGKIFAALREEVDELIEMADKKPGLSESERRVKEKLHESLDISEEFIGKEVEDIEKEINDDKDE